MKLTKKAKDAIIEHAKECYPLESCGLIINRQYVPCNNIASREEDFVIDPRDLVKAEALGKVQAIVHSHPDGTCQPSLVDNQNIDKHGVPWVIVGYPEIEFGIYYEGIKQPLINRQYVHGELDCFTIIKDYYERELDIKLDDFERVDRWWETAESSLYLDNYKSQGFVEVDDLQRHDIILCAVQPTKQVNHALIYLGDDGSLKSEDTEPCIGDHLVLHHPYGRRSKREIYGNAWQGRTALIIRHKSLIGGYNNAQED